MSREVLNGAVVRSPDLSPIESGFSVLKMRVKRELLYFRTSTNTACRAAMREALQSIGPEQMRGEWKFVYGVPALPTAAEEDEVVALVIVALAVRKLGEKE